MLKRLIPSIFSAALASAPISMAALELHVSPLGSDTALGTADAPLRTLHAARDRARAVAGREPVLVVLHDGVYYLEDTLVFGPADSGSAQAPVRYQAQNEGRAVISGGVRLDLRWESGPEGIQQAETPAGLVIDQLFVDGVRQPMARYPNFDPAANATPYNGFAADAFSPARAARWADPTGGYIHAMHSKRWGGYHYRITGKNSAGEVTYEGGWQNNRPGAIHPEHRMVENIREELDAPGEWFHDRKANRLFFLPPKDTRLESALVEAVRLPDLVQLRGEPGKPVRFITLSGLVFRHAARTFMDNREPLLRSDWTIHRGGALLFENTEDCAVVDSFFDQPGGNAVFVNNYNRRVRISGVQIFGAGASGVAFVGDPAAVRNPVFNYNAPHDLSLVDLTSGPIGENYPMDCVVEDSLLHRIGVVEKQGAGVQISMSRRIAVRHCSIYETSRAGININEGTWGGHRIEGCDVFDTVRETSDHGSFNSWGRDRFWVPDTKLTADAVAAHPELPFLDAVEPTIIRDSRWRCDHGWDIDLDDGSTNYEITNNLLLKGGLKLREGYRRIVKNNIIVGNSLHPHIWYPKSGDVFVSNIVMGSYRQALMREDKWGEEIDRNLFTTNQLDRTRFLKNGADAASVVGDPLFADPDRGDYTVRNEELARAIGFKNFPMDLFGVLKPSLRAIARVPDFPQISIKPDLTPAQAAPDATSAVVILLGATLSEPRGDALSAYGVSFDSGGVSIDAIASDSPLGGKEGLRKGDLVQALNGKPVKTIADFKNALSRSADGRLAFAGIRNQAPLSVIVQVQPIP